MERQSQTIDAMHESGAEDRRLRGSGGSLSGKTIQFIRIAGSPGIEVEGVKLWTLQRKP